MREIAESRLGAKRLPAASRVFPHRSVRLPVRLVDLPSHAHARIGRGIDSGVIRLILSESGEVVVARSAIR
jgi:hypothetical protein